MTASREELPDQRYGRSADARADRQLKIIGAALGAVLLAGTAWMGISYISGQDVSGELIKSKVVSAHKVEAHLEVRKDSGTQGVCTLRSLSEDHGEVGRLDAKIDDRADRVDTVVTIRTTARATSTELIGCEPASRS
ncbi:DUF4307 domain-containing protein [Streptomyces sp. H27-D2]|uniref:DUF4307 domain-containing protein n=1 Tax=Streptomyces sp. H27-D2 TaxID=3046304 RepID=UPI002DBCC2E1|nr:DUF4307 domain-containing protein [Streptomyces sp. H27-D2]MEC4017165.1 DUF4307 domain-containing protein [Streptomyces sp. H27-D2]